MLGSDPDVHRASAPARSRAKGAATTPTSTRTRKDRLLAEGAAQFDLAERKKSYSALQKLIRDDLAILPLFQSAIAEGTKEGP